MTTSQNEQILAALEEGRSLTPLDALQDFGCMRLAARIHDLKEQGHHILMDEVRDRKTGKKYARYKLANVAAQGEFRF